jgi:hypothetical protein
MPGGVINVKSIKVDGQIEPLDVSGTAGTLTGANNDVLASEFVTNASTHTLEIEGDYQAGSAGDPPSFNAGDKLTGISVQTGYNYSGDLLVTRFGSRFDDVKQLIKYSFAGNFTGVVTRSATS